MNTPNLRYADVGITQKSGSLVREGTAVKYAAIAGWATD